jgi:hypothetical protein
MTVLSLGDQGNAEGLESDAGAFFVGLLHLNHLLAPRSFSYPLIFPLPQRRIPQHHCSVTILRHAKVSKETSYMAKRDLLSLADLNVAGTVSFYPAPKGDSYSSPMPPVQAPGYQGFS